MTSTVIKREQCYDTCKQECIPVGWVPPTAVAVLGGVSTRHPPGAEPPGPGTPSGGDPLGADPPGAAPPPTRHPPPTWSRHLPGADPPC